MVELDPSGKDPHSVGAKLDKGKNRIGLCINGFALALQAVSEVTSFGASKYTPNGWKEVPQALDRYTDAMYRHLLQEATGEVYDKDSKLLHAAHTAWNALARLHFIIEEQNASK